MRRSPEAREEAPSEYDVVDVYLGPTQKLLAEGDQERAGVENTNTYGSQFGCGDSLQIDETADPRTMRHNGLVERGFRVRL